MNICVIHSFWSDLRDQNYDDDDVDDDDDDDNEHYLLLLKNCFSITTL